jgi:hypothetical protein
VRSEKISATQSTEEHGKIKKVKDKEIWGDAVL